jgi:RHS repeat-associated protein
MGYFLTTEAETAVPEKSPARPKTHTPLPRLQERGLRFYSTELGRWMSRDPIGERGGVHVLGFAMNCPLDLVDPTGLMIS